MTTPGSLCEGSQKTASSFSRAILYSPHTNTSDVETVMGLVQAKVETTRGVSAGTLDSLFIGFGSEEDLVAYAIANPNSVYLGVVFPSTNLSSSLNVAYTIRPPSNKCRDTTLQYPDWDVQVRSDGSNALPVNNSVSCLVCVHRDPSPPPATGTPGHPQCKTLSTGPSSNCVRVVPPATSSSTLSGSPIPSTLPMTLLAPSQPLCPSL